MTEKKSHTEYRHYTLPMDFPVLTLYGDRWHISDIPSNHLHFHNCLEIGYCHSNGGYMELGTNKVAFEAGDVTCIPRYIPHTTYSHPSALSRWSYIFFDPDRLFEYDLLPMEDHYEKAENTMKVSTFIFKGEDADRLRRLVELALEELIDKKAYYKETATGLLKATYIELLRLHKKNDQKQAQNSKESTMVISPAINHIYTHYMTDINIDDLAKLCAFSPTHFRRTFKTIMGTSPLSFLNSTRIDEACKRLKSSDDTILSVAENVGFRSISAFNRQFIKLLGTTPKEWRNNSAKNLRDAKSRILTFEGWL